MKRNLIINSSESLARAKATVSEIFRDHHYVRLTLVTGRDRSKDQNSLLHAWLSQISRETGEDTPAGIKAFVKLHFGVPILRAENEEFQAMYDENIKPLNYQQKLAIVEYLPVTSIMTVAQCSQLLKDIQMHYAARTTDPVNLEWPEEMLDKPPAKE
jgi:hypothetical protein